MKSAIVRQSLRGAAAVAAAVLISAAPGPGKDVKSAAPSLAAAGTPFAAAWEKGFNESWPILFDNLMEPTPSFSTRFVQPGPAWPGQVFLWDTALMSLVWLHWDAETAAEINLAVLDYADRGRLQHTVGGGVITKDTQPPVMAWAIWQIFQHTGDREYLKRTYPALKNYNRWLYENRRLGNGLFFWVHPFESGMDNTPRFANSDASKVGPMRDIAAIDLSSFVFLQNKTLAKMAEEIGENEDAGRFTKQADELKNLINQNLWDEPSGYYFDRNVKTGKFTRVRAVASLLPLFAGVPDAARAKIIRDHIMNPAEFNTYFPLPSVARDDPAFEKDMWRGPVWINTSYMIIKGLEDYGYRDEAADLAFRTVDGVYRNYTLTGEFLEFYDPDHDGFQDLDRKRHKWNPFAKKTPPRFRFVGWTGLANNLLIEDLMGIGPDGQRLTSAPGFPPAAQGLNLTLSIPAHDLVFSTEAIPPGGKSPDL